jgi:anti-sigma-K factor RskA
VTCEELRECLELYALGLLEEPERSELHRHLQTGCAVCVPAFKRALATNAAIATLAPLVDPPARVAKRVRALSAVQEPRAGKWLPVWAAAAAILLSICVWLGLRDRRYAAELADARSELSQARAQGSRTAAQLARVQSALDFLNAPDTRLVVSGRGGIVLPPRARVFINQDRGVLLMADNLPPAPQGKVFEMWVIPKKGAPRPAGLFQSEPGGSALHLLTEPVDIADTGAVAVTLEPESGSLAPTSKPFIVVPL